jgi:sec-independent protein translocase protein TatA
VSEWIVVAVIGVVLLFSAKKLPDMARGLGQSMRVLKAETRGLKEDDERPRDTEAARRGE